MSTRYVWYTYNVEQEKVQTEEESTSSGRYYPVGQTYWAAAGTNYSFNNNTGAYILGSGYKWLSTEWGANARQYPYLMLTWSDTTNKTPVSPGPLLYNKYQNNYSQDLIWKYLFKDQVNYVIYYTIVLVQANDFSKVTINNYTSYQKPIGYLYSKDVDVQGTSKQGTVVSNTSSAYPSDGKQNNLWYVYQGSDSIDPVSVEYSKTGDIYGGEKITVTVNKGSPKFGGTIYYLYQYSVDGKTWTNSGERSSSSSRIITVPDGAKQFQVRVLASDSYGFTSTTYVYGTTLGVQNLKLYVGVGNKSRAAEKMYVGVNGKSREVIKAYVGVAGKAKSFL